MVTREKAYFIMISKSIQKEDIKKDYEHICYKGLQNTLQKLTELKGEINNLTTIVEDVNTPFSIRDRTIRKSTRIDMYQKKNKR